MFGCRLGPQSRVSSGKPYSRRAICSRVLMTLKRVPDAETLSILRLQPVESRFELCEEARGQVIDVRQHIGPRTSRPGTVRGYHPKELPEWTDQRGGLD
jgi:hypothetical protein